MRLMRGLLAVGSIATASALTLSAASVAGATATAATPRGAVKAAAHQHMSAKFVTGARRALVKYLHDGHPQIDLVKPGAPAESVSGTANTESYNWSGYADASSVNGTFTAVSGEWRTPAVTCSAEDQLTSEWVGLDGFNNSTVEQDGTLEWCFHSKAMYFTWYEMYPAGTIVVGTTLQPNDLIKASVSVTGTTYTLALTDVTNGANSFSTTAACASCTDTSAEWISERPAFQVGIAPLANYSNWGIYNARVTANGHSTILLGYPSNYKINMVDATNTYMLNTTSAIANPHLPNNGFSTHWRNSY